MLGESLEQNKLIRNVIIITILNKKFQTKSSYYFYGYSIMTKCKIALEKFDTLRYNNL